MLDVKRGRIERLVPRSPGAPSTVPGLSTTAALYRVGKIWHAIQLGSGYMRKGTCDRARGDFGKSGETGAASEWQCYRSSFRGTRKRFPFRNICPYTGFNATAGLALP